MDRPASYRITVSGHLDISWSSRLCGMRITTIDGKDTRDVTVLEGSLIDQAALSGVLNTLYDLQLPLVSVDCLNCNTKNKGSNP